MATLTNTRLTTFEAGTPNIGALILENFLGVELILDPATSSGETVYGLLHRVLRGHAPGVDAIAYSATPAISFTGKAAQVISLTGNATFSFSNLAAGRPVRLLIAADATPRTLAWPAGVNWVGSPILSIDANAFLIVELISAGTTDTDVWVTAGAGSGGGGGGASGAAYVFNTATSGDPGTGQILLNNATVASATALNISETDDDGNGLAALIAAWDDATGTVKGTLKIQDEALPSNFAFFDITGTITDSGTYDTFSATHIASGGTLTNGMSVRVEFTRAGDAGAAGATGATGAAGGYNYKFNTATSGDPGTGKLLFDNATIASATAMNICETADDAAGLAGVLAAWDDSTSTVKGLVSVIDKANPANYAFFNITGTITDAGTYDTFTVAHVASGGTIANNADVSVNFSRTGDLGATGASGTTASLGLLLAVAGGNYLS